jgi:hypothetical protein
MLGILPQLNFTQGFYLGLWLTTCTCSVDGLVSVNKGKVVAVTYAELLARSDVT